MILEHFLKYKAMKEVVSEMYIITNFSKEEIIRQNKCKMRFSNRFLLKLNVDKNDDN